MKLLQFFKEAFGELPDDDNISSALINVAQKIGSRQFCSRIFGFVLSRGYNEFLDYGLAALKFNQFLSSFNEHDGYDIYYDEDPDAQTYGGYFVPGIIAEFLWQDRHDTGGNVDFNLLKFVEKNKNNPKFNETKFWFQVSIILIECFNANGTGDQIWRCHLAVTEK